MAYAPNYYNYQVAVIFAIMIGGMLLLAGVVGAIYFICVVNMRKKKGFQRAPSFGKQRLVGATWPPPQQVYEQQQPQYGMMPSPVPDQHNGFGQQHPQQQRSQPSPYSQAAAVSYGYQPQQQAQYIPQQQQHQPQQQQQQQYVPQQQQHEGPRIRDIHPKYTYQQGPITWTTVTPVAGYSQPQLVAGGGGGGGESAGYHMSSV